MLNFDEVQSILSQIESDPVLKDAALAECESLYAELFVIAGSEFTGENILSYLNLADPGQAYSVTEYLCEILTLEKDIEKIKVEFNTEDVGIIYPELLKRESQKTFPGEYCSRYEENEAEWQDKLLRDEVKEQYDRLIEVFKKTVYVNLSNYKGECESEMMLIKSAGLRKYYSKYSYGE